MRMGCADWLTYGLCRDIILLLHEPEEAVLAMSGKLKQRVQRIDSLNSNRLSGNAHNE